MFLVLLYGGHDGVHYVTRAVDTEVHVAAPEHNIEAGRDVILSFCESDVENDRIENVLWSLKIYCNYFDQLTQQW